MDPRKSSFRASPKDYWGRHFAGSQAWIASGFKDVAGARIASEALQRWLSAYPDQAADVTHIALSSATTALVAGEIGVAADFAGTVIDAAAFAALETPEQREQIALGALTFAASRTEAGRASERGRALAIARAFIAQMDDAGPLCAWARGWSELIEGEGYETYLERTAAVLQFGAARDRIEPLLRNTRLRKSLVRVWVTLVFGDQLGGTITTEQGEEFVLKRLKSDYLHAALGHARTAADGSLAVASAQTAAAACAEYGVPGDVTSTDLRAALVRLPAVDRASFLDPLLRGLEHRSGAHASALTSMLMGLRFEEEEDDERAIRQSGKSAALAGDGHAWSIVAANMINRRARKGEWVDDKLFDMFLVPFSDTERALRSSPRHAPFRAHFDFVLQRLARQALASFAGEPSSRNSERLSGALEAARTPNFEMGPVRDARSQEFERARAAARDWLGRMAHALRRHADAVVVIPVVDSEGTSFLSVAAAAPCIVVHDATKEFAEAAGALADGMRKQFETGRFNKSVERLGATTYRALPKALQSLLETHGTVLVLPELAAGGASLPYELLRSPRGFLGLTHVVARFGCLRDAVLALESSEIAVDAHTRLVCAAAANALPGQRLSSAALEVAAVEEVATRAHWEVRSIDEEALTPQVLLDGMDTASLVHVAAHGEAFGGAPSIVLPHGERLSTETLEAHRGDLPAVVYLSACHLGASEYFGGGVSRGLSEALVAKGARAVVACQWPLEDRAAARIAREFYGALRKNPIGVAMREARARVSDDAAGAVPAAHWASVILIGNPWHSAKGRTGPSDEFSRHLQDATDVALTATARKAARRARSKLLAVDRTDRRVEAICSWCDAAESVFVGREDERMGEMLDELASVAGDLGELQAAATCRLASVELATRGGDLDRQRVTLDAAIDACQAMSRLDPKWSRVLQQVMARRQRLDLRLEPETIRLGSGLTVNDRSDPAVAAVFEVQNALDLQVTRRTGELMVRLPDLSLDDLAWNAVVIGQRNRFLDEFACAGFATQIGRRAVVRGWIDADAEADFRRIAAGLLHYLWSSQRMTHLERELAIAQSATLKIAWAALGSAQAKSESNLGVAGLEVVKAGEALLADVQEAQGERFARALQRLRGESGSAPRALSVGQAVRALISGVANGSRERAYRAIWGSGFMLELAHKLRTKNRAATAGEVGYEHDSLQRDMESHLMPYLAEGFAAIGRGNPLLGWL